MHDERLLRIGCGGTWPPSTAPTRPPPGEGSPPSARGRGSWGSTAALSDHRGALAVIAAAAVAVVLLVSATASTQPADALTQNPDGSITLTFNDLQAAIP